MGVEMSEKTEPKLTRADNTPEGEKIWDIVERAAARAPNSPERLPEPKIEPCAGVVGHGGITGVPYMVHCFGCASATERIAELEQKIKDAGNLLAVLHCDGGHYVAEVGWQAGCRVAGERVLAERQDLDKHERDLTSMQTLAWGLVTELKQCEQVFLAQGMGICALHPEAAILKAKEAGVFPKEVGDGG